MSLSLILCEGKTDAIIIGYLMIGRYGWSYRKHVPSMTAPTPRVDVWPWRGLRRHMQRRWKDPVRSLSERVDFPNSKGYGA